MSFTPSIALALQLYLYIMVAKTLDLIYRKPYHQCGKTVFILTQHRPQVIYYTDDRFVTTIVNLKHTSEIEHA